MVAASVDGEEWRCSSEDNSQQGRLRGHVNVLSDPE